MKALCPTPERNLEIRDVPAPVTAAPEHVLIRMHANGINPGDITFLKRALPIGTGTRLHDVWGVSGAGQVTAIGDGVPSEYLGKNVSVYRSLVPTDQTIGTWCEVAQMHYLTCAILPASSDAVDYAGSLVNLITPYAFLRQAQQEGHTGALITAGNSATGIAMLGMGLAHNFPVVSIVRTESGRQELQALGAKQVLAQSDSDFDQKLAAATESEKATAIFDGSGGDLLTRVLPLVPRGSTVYSYGYLGGKTPIAFPTELLIVKNLVVKSFSNFGSPTVRDKAQLKAALAEISRTIDMPHFKTKPGKIFGYEQVEEAMNYKDEHGGKAIMKPTL